MMSWLTVAMELRKSKEKQKLMRQQERFNRQQQMKMEKEVRSQQVNEVSLFNCSNLLTIFADLT